ELELYVVDLGDGGVGAEIAPGEDGWLPQVRVVGVAADREYGLAVLRELAGELRRRERACAALGVPGYAQLRVAGPQLGRLVCVLDDFPRLVADDDRLTADAWAVLDELARRGRAYGVHLVLAGGGLRAVPQLANTREALGGQFPVRVALPGGGDVLDPSNDAAAALALGTAVVNTAGGFGGPRGATRGHERTIRFPDPYASRATLAALRRRGFTTRTPDAGPPAVFHGRAVPTLADDPTYRAALAGEVTRPAVLLGHTIDLPRATAAFPLDKSAGRHLAVMAPGDDGAALLDTAARSLAIAQRPARFVVCAAESAGGAVAEALAKELAVTHDTALVDAGGLRYAVDSPAYLIVFGMDALLDGGQLPPERLRELLHGGPARGVHVVSWWRSARRLSDALGARGRDDLAGLVFLDVTGIDVAALTGQPLDWRHRPGRALLYDRHADRASVIVPFAPPGGDR
ncbi:MAG TPA: cell division protein FtsK, partial [Pilimelia sp.]|nr:cell division protein FtsK [Pilimelia sp.]